MDFRSQDVGFELRVFIPLTEDFLRTIFYPGKIVIICRAKIKLAFVNARCLWRLNLVLGGKTLKQAREDLTLALLSKGPFTLAILAAIFAAIPSTISRRVSYWRFRGDLNRQ